MKDNLKLLVGTGSLLLVVAATVYIIYTSGVLNPESNKGLSKSNSKPDSANYA